MRWSAWACWSYADPGWLEGFLKAMPGISMGVAVAIANTFPWDRYETFVDVGMVQGALPIQERYPRNTSRGERRLPCRLVLWPGAGVESRT